MASNKEEREEEREEERSRILELVEMLPDVLYEVDATLKFTYINSIAYKIFGYSEEQFKDGVYLLDFIDETYLEKATRNVEHILKGGRGAPTEYLLKREDGTKFYAMVNSKPIFRDGKVVGMRGTVSDIDDFIRTREALGESEARLRTAIESFPFDFFILDENHTYVMQNSTCKEHWGDVVGKQPEDVSQGNDVLEVWRNNNARAYNGETVKEEVSFNIKGQLHYLYNIISPIYDGEIQKGILGLNIDITERKLAEMKVHDLLERENQQLKELDEMRQEFVMNAAHELKTPLLFIDSTSKFIIDFFKDKMSEDLLKQIHYVRLGSIRLKKIVQNMLDFSHMVCGDLELDNKMIELTSVIAEAIDETKQLAQQRGQELKHEFPRVIKIFGDKYRLKQVFFNLISNAIKNSPFNSSIKINLEESANFVEVSVQDDGIGLTDEEKAKLFTKFGKITRKEPNLDIDIQGTGLGLFLSKKIIECYDGRIWATSPGRGKGCTFHVRLPKSTTSTSPTTRS
ncbi:MAG: PAS domain-containing sensor histidine kinase [Promethearchaeota archaeon]